MRGEIDARQAAMATVRVSPSTSGTIGSERRFREQVATATSCNTTLETPASVSGHSARLGV
jgi:hypothetical protein